MQHEGGTAPVTWQTWSWWFPSIGTTLDKLAKFSLLARRPAPTSLVGVLWTLIEGLRLPYLWVTGESVLCATILLYRSSNPLASTCFALGVVSPWNHAFGNGLRQWAGRGGGEVGWVGKLWVWRHSMRGLEKLCRAATVDRATCLCCLRSQGSPLTHTEDGYPSMIHSSSACNAAAAAAAGRQHCRCASGKL